MVQDCVEEQAALEQGCDEPPLEKEPSSDQENTNTLCGNAVEEQPVPPVRGYATRSAVAAAKAAAAAAAASSSVDVEAKGASAPDAVAVQGAGKAPSAAPRRLSERVDAKGVEADRQSVGSGSSAAGAAAWDALCAEVLSASEVLAVSRVMRTEAAAE